VHSQLLASQASEPCVRSDFFTFSFSSITGLKSFEDQGVESFTR
jgi:hypothetical protein